MLFFAYLATSIYPLIGAPATGKTSIIEALAPHEVTVAEAATDIIASYMNGGEKEPWKLPGFEVEVINEKIRREDEALLAAKAKEKTYIFVDRGLLDNLVYLTVNHKENTEEYKNIEEKLRTARAFERYRAVFFVEPHNGNHYRADPSGVRHETTDEALKLGEMIRNVYSKYYQVINVPPHMTPAERAAFVEKKVKELES